MTPPKSLSLQHAVKFFVEDADLCETLVGYVRQAIRAGQSALVITTPTHWKELAHRMSGRGNSEGRLGAGDPTRDASPLGDVRLEELLERGQVVFLDAKEARDELMVKGEPSRARFETHFAALIEQMNEAWPGVYVYDETGDLLAHDGQFGPLRQLETMWDECRRDTGFGLLSGLRLDNFSEPAHEQPFDNVCEARHQVFAAGDSGAADVAKWQRRTLTLGRRLDQKQEALEQTQRELEYERARHRERSEFIGKFAHEIRNPMAPVLCAVEMMNLRGDTTVDRERGIIERQISKMVQLVDDFQDATRVMFDRVEFEKSHTELEDIVHKAVERTEATIEAREHRLNVEVPRSGLLVDADPARLAQAIAEMLENAAIYTPVGGKIWLTAQPEAGSVAISIRDDGPGVDPSILDDVFEMFVQGDVDDSVDIRGMGLGLAMVRKIADAHDGAVAAYSNVTTQAGSDATGSEFVMRLPLVPSHERVPKVSRLKKGEIASGGQVLVVDDNEDFASMLADTLELLGHEVRVAYNASDALEILDDFWPDLALLDLNLPGMSGHQLAERIKGQSLARTESRLVALTGYSDEQKRKRSEEIGFDAHLVKPIVLSQLQETLDKVLGD